MLTSTSRSRVHKDTKVSVVFLPETLVGVLYEILRFIEVDAKLCTEDFFFYKLEISDMSV
jgi:hypothetical protein